jgi:hypothetical protein
MVIARVVDMLVVRVVGYEKVILAKSFQFFFQIKKLKSFIQINKIISHHCTMATSKITVFLRGATDELTKSLRENGFLTVQPERESELSALLEKFNEEMYGAPTSAGSPRRPKQTDVRVVAETTITYDRDYLTKQSVQELLRIAKAKGCKNLGPRKKESLIEKILQHYCKHYEFSFL